jgi:hypothetical protein
MLEKRRGGWKSIGMISEEFRGFRLDIWRGRVGPSSMGVRVMSCGRISKDLACSCGSKDDSVGVFNADLRLEGLESSTGERGRVVLRVVGAGFLVPFKPESCDFPGVVLMMEGIGGVSVAVLFIVVEYLLLEELGTLKLGVAGEPRTDRAGPP